jgi:hypothetical protein
MFGGRSRIVESSNKERRQMVSEMRILGSSREGMERIIERALITHPDGRGREPKLDYRNHQLMA